MTEICDYCVTRTRTTVACDWPRRRVGDPSDGVVGDRSDGEVGRVGGGA